MNPYDRNFFLSLQEGSLRSARVVVPLLLKFLKPSRVIDVGCATGAWLAVMRECGIEDVWGVDYDYLDSDILLVPSDRILRCDLTGDVNVGFKSDLVLSLEVAEHLPESSADSFVASLVKLGPYILFSAAIPGQGGHCHLNEQWPEYWAERFAQHGFKPVDCLRSQIWNHTDVGYWYRQNLLLYVQWSHLKHNRKLRRFGSATQLRQVHPELYRIKCLGEAK